jgi:hypothetical protein
MVSTMVAGCAILSGAPIKFPTIYRIGVHDNSEDLLLREALCFAVVLTGVIEHLFFLIYFPCLSLVSSEVEAFSL